MANQYVKNLKVFYFLSYQHEVINKNNLITMSSEHKQNQEENQFIKIHSLYKVNSKINFARKVSHLNCFIPSMGL